MPLIVTVNKGYINWMYLLHSINSDCQYEINHWMYLLHAVNSDCQYGIYQLDVFCCIPLLSIGDKSLDVSAASH